jgi:putative transcriptional regulator
MTARKRPSEQTLLSFSAGRLRPAQALVVETHLALCEPSRERVTTFEDMGGLLLQRLPAAQLSQNALDRMLERLDHAEPTGSHSAGQGRAPIRGLPDLPEPLLRQRIGRRRWAGSGIHYRRICVQGDTGCHVILLEVAPGHALPQHSHSGAEFTCVLSGSYSDGDDVFTPGDFDANDAAVDHQPIAGPDMPCFCVVALEGGIRLHGMGGPLRRLFSGGLVGDALRGSDKRNAE